MLLMLHDAYCLLYLLFYTYFCIYIYPCFSNVCAKHQLGTSIVFKVRFRIVAINSHKLRKSRQRSRDTMLGCFTSSRDCLLMIVSTQWVSSVHRMLQCRRFRGETTHNLTFFISGKLPENRPKPKSKD